MMNSIFVTPPDVEIDFPARQDKRLLAVESELAGLLKKMEGKTSTLSPVIRAAWDSGNLRVTTKNSPATATDAHISIVAHITSEELRTTLRGTDAVNGFGNRFLFCAATRSKKLPRGGELTEADFESFAELLKPGYLFAGSAETLEMTEDAWVLFERHYEELTEGGTGLIGKIIARGAPQVRRLALIFAVADSSARIEVVHLQAALEVWRYCRESAEFAFGSSGFAEDGKKILKALRTNGPMSKTEISSRVFQKNRTAEDIDNALEWLSSQGLGRPETVVTGGRPKEVWMATETA